MQLALQDNHRLKVLLKAEDRQLQPEGNDLPQDIQESKAVRRGGIRRSPRRSPVDPGLPRGARFTTAVQKKLIPGR